MPNPNNILYTIGGPESPAGSAAERTVVIPLRGVPTIKKTAERAIDPVITGNRIDAGEFAMAFNVAGNIPLAYRAVAGIGKLWKSVLGTEETPVQVGSCIRIMYTGDEASCKIVPDTSADTLDSDIGTKGSEEADSNFGTAGSIDLTAGATDTVGELVTTIDAYDDYVCEKVWGSDDVDAADIVEFTSPGNYRQGKSRWVYIWFSSSTSGVYHHELTPDLSTTELSTYSIQGDNLGDNLLWDGCVVNVFNMSAALKGFVEADCDILGMEETGSQDASALTLADIEALVFANGDFYLGENQYTYLRNHSLSVNNQHNAEGFGQGSLYRLYHSKSKILISGDFQVRLDDNIFSERAKVFTDDVIGISFYYEGATIAESMKEACIIELPYCGLGDFEWVDNNGTFDARIPFKAFKPKGTLYNDPLTVHLITTDSGTY